jgi:phage recombination protein Bet
MSEAELVKVLESSIYPGADIESIKLVIGYCKANSLDPMQKPVHIVPMSVKVKGKNGERDSYVKRDVIMPGVGLYRTQAARTKEYVGIDEAQFGETKTLTIDEFKMEYPDWCSVVVHRQVSGLPRAFSSGRVYWLETYATAGNDTKMPNAMWKKRGFGQLEKCAEAMALRRAFPELGAAPTAEELEGKTFDHDETPAPPALEGPKAKDEKPGGNKVIEGEAVDQGGASGASVAAEKKPEPQPKQGGNGDKPLSPTQQKILRNSLERAALNELDLSTKFGVNVDGLKASDFNAVASWIADRAP